MPIYQKISVNGARFFLHRYVWECANGPIPDGMHVHHVNGDTSDNRIENLQLLSIQAHAELHKQRHPKTKECVVCGSTFTPHPTKRKRAQTCSKPCYSELARRQNEARLQDPAYHEKLSHGAIRGGAAERGKTLVMHRWHPEIFKKEP